jgi:hypothetical protein
MPAAQPDELVQALENKFEPDDDGAVAAGRRTEVTVFIIVSGVSSEPWISMVASASWRR